MLLVLVLDTRWGLAKAWPLGPMGVRPETTADLVCTIKVEVHGMRRDFIRFDAPPANRCVFATARYSLCRRLQVRRFNRFKNI